jgi:hypothetical protein
LLIVVEIQWHWHLLGSDEGLMTDDITMVGMHKRIITWQDKEQEPERDKAHFLYNNSFSLDPSYLLHGTSIHPHEEEAPKGLTTFH